MTNNIKVLDLRLTSAEEQERQIEEMHTEGYELKIVDSGFAYFFPIIEKGGLMIPINENIEDYVKRDKLPPTPQRLPAESYPNRTTPWGDKKTNFTC